LRHPSTPIYRTDAVPAARRQYFILQRRKIAALSCHSIREETPSLSLITVG
jgi:hypothetical protein